MDRLCVYGYALNKNLYIKKCREMLLLRFNGEIPKFYVHSFGCQGNISEGEKIQGVLSELGFSRAFNINLADIVILNTCAIREKAEDKVFSHLGNLVSLKKVYSNKIIGICGCMVQQEHIKQRIEEHFPTVDLVFGPHVIYKLPELLYFALCKRKGTYSDISSKESLQEGLPTLRSSNIKALVPIIYGCNNFCSYCIVPYVKGRERSRNFSAIVDEVKGLVENGYKDITLLGQNVNSYGKDLNIKDGFAKLLYELNKIDGNFRIRFMTSHPKDFSKGLIDVIASCNKVCRHFHLPVQSGCDRILKAMNRKYTVEEYLNILYYAREVISGVTFTTDIIVGFPGESYCDFKETLKLVEIARYMSIFNFIYSKRKGTRAANLPDGVPKKEKVAWLKELIGLQNNISCCLNSAYVGMVKSVLFEGVSSSDESLMVGRTDENILVVCGKNLSKIGQICSVQIIKSCRTMLFGEVL